MKYVIAEPTERGKHCIGVVDTMKSVEYLVAVLEKANYKNLQITCVEDEIGKLIEDFQKDWSRLAGIHLDGGE